MATNITPLHDRVIIRRIEDTNNQTAAGFSSPTQPKKNRRKAKSSPPAKANIKKTAPVSRWTSKQATAFFSASTAVRKSRLTVKSC